MGDAMLFWSRISDEDCSKALQRQYSDLVDNLDPAKIIAGLFSARVLTQTAKEDIEGQSPPSAVRGALLMKVSQRGKAAFNIFAGLLKENQPNLFEKLVRSLPNYPGRDAYMTQDSDSAPLPTERSPDATNAPTIDQVDTLGADTTHDTGYLFVAMLLFVAEQQTHIELRTLFHQDRDELQRQVDEWQLQKKRPIEVLPKAITSFDVNADDAHISVTNKHGYSHCCQPVRGWRFRWLVDLGGQAWREQDLLRVTLWRNSNGSPLGTFIFSDLRVYTGSDFLPLLGFSSAHHPRSHSGGDEGLMRRKESEDNALPTSAVHALSQISQSVGMICGEKSGFVGTGFCVGGQTKLYIMTCHHVFKGLKEETATIRFGDVLLSGKEVVYNLKPSGDFDNDNGAGVELDFSILDFEYPESNKPLPIDCSMDDFDFIKDQGRHKHYLMIIGYVGSTFKRVIDTSAEYLQPTEAEVDSLVNEFWLMRDKNPDHKAIYKAGYDIRATELYYHMVVHAHGSSGSPVLYCSRDGKVRLVGIHRRGLPTYFYANDANGAKLFSDMPPDRYLLEAGVRMSKVYEALAGYPILQSTIFPTLK